MSPMGSEADDETNAAADVEAFANREDEPDEPAGQRHALPSPPTRPLPRRVPSEHLKGTPPAVSPPTDHTVRHLLDILKRLP